MTLQEIADETEKYLLDAGMFEEVKQAEIKLPLRDNLRTDPRYYDSDHYALHYLILYCHIKTQEPIPENIYTKMVLEGNKWVALCQQ